MILKINNIFFKCSFPTIQSYYFHTCGDYYYFYICSFFIWVQTPKYNNRNGKFMYYLRMNNL